VLLHDVTDPQLGEVIQTCLIRLDIAPQRVRVSNHLPVRVRTLILVEGLSEHGTYMSPLVRDCHARLSHGIAGIGHPRVFIARGSGRLRDFADPRQAEIVAEEQGYHVFRPERGGFVDQIAAMRDARVVAGAMGAAMTSLAYARQPAQVLTFAAAAMPDTFFWFIATLFGHRYREIRCIQPVEPVATGASYDRPLLIGETELRQHLSACRS
jgi:capsular polysaccharide biosynthesis protein